MEFTLNLGKVAYNGTRKINRLTLDVRVAPDFIAISGAIWNGNGTDALVCGQCVTEVVNLVPNNLVAQRLLTIWRQYHLKPAPEAVRNELRTMALFAE